MRIGILTLPFNNNYGGYLQAYALQYVIKHMGHEAELIFRLHNRRSLRWRVSHFVKAVARNVLNRGDQPLLLSQYRELREKGRLLMPFVDGKIRRTKPLYSSFELKCYARGRYDVIVAGSDQLWRPDYVPNIEDFFLAFEHDARVKKVSYAASFGTGTPKYSDEERLLCGQCLAQFKAVSLREESGIDVIHRFGWQAPGLTVVLDPTMLLPATHYESLVGSSNAEAKGKIFCYVLDQSPVAQQIINTASLLLQREQYHIIEASLWKEEDYLMPSIESWLSGINNSSFVVTDSFHGTVFCILFNKPFAVYVNQERGSDRFTTLLGHFDLADRIVTSTADLSRVLSASIDWAHVNTLLEQKRSESMLFLKKALSS